MLHLKRVANLYEKINMQYCRDIETLAKKKTDKESNNIK